MQLKVKRLTSTAKLPTKAHNNDAGWDLYADIEKPVTIPTNGLQVIDTGIAVGIPDGYCGVIKDRSSFGVAGHHILGGIIDSQYRSSIKVIMYSFRGKVINTGDKFAQMLILPVPKLELVEVDSLDETERGEKGFGSSDIENKVNEHHNGHVVAKNWLQQQFDKAEENLGKLPKKWREELERYWNYHMNTKPFRPKDEDHQ